MHIRSNYFTLELRKVPKYGQAPDEGTTIITPDQSAILRPLSPNDGMLALADTPRARERLC